MKNLTLALLLAVLINNYTRLKAMRPEGAAYRQ